MLNKLPVEIFLHLCNFLDARACMTLLDKREISDEFENIMSKRVIAELKKYGLEDLVPLLSADNAIIAGSFVLKVVNNEKWTPCDIDIFGYDLDAIESMLKERHGYKAFKNNPPGQRSYYMKGCVNPVRNVTELYADNRIDIQLIRYEPICKTIGNGLIITPGNRNEELRVIPPIHKSLSMYRPLTKREYYPEIRDADYYALAKPIELISIYFDLNFCKIAFDGTKVCSFYWDAVVQKKSAYLLDAANKSLRVKKYSKRGYIISGEDINHTKVIL